MFPALAAILPVFTIILLGHALHSRNFPGPGFWAGAERLTYFLLLPLLLFTSVATADLAQAHGIRMLLAVGVLAYTGQSAAAFLARFALRLDGKRFGSLFQGAVRFNNYIGISLVAGLYGQAGIALYAALISLAIPLSNILAVAVMAKWSAETPPGWNATLKTLLHNPLIIGTVAGIAVNLAGVPLAPVMPLLDLLTAAALPVGLLCVGAAIDVGSLRRDGAPLAAGVALKLAVFPLVFWGVGTGLSLPPMALGVGVIFAALPCAASCTILARQLGADVPLMAGITAFTTLASLVTLSVVLSLLPH